MHPSAVDADERGPARDAASADPAAWGSVAEAVEFRAQATPDADAILAGERVVTYRELNAAANGLAERMIATGIGREDVVAVQARRSVETLTAMLAVLKAGGAFMPLDPADPPARVAAVVRDADPGAIVVGPQDDGRFHGLGIPLMDPFSESAPDRNPRSGVGPHDAACVYYTSGSTGNAKGVVLEHRGLMNHLRWVDRRLLGERQIGLPLVNRPTFAASLKQLFAPWLRGQPVWLVEDAVVTHPRALLHELADRGPVALNCVPALWQAMLRATQEGEAAPPENIALVCFSGESPGRTLIESSLATCPDLELWNVYGATETTGISVAGRIDSEAPSRIGRPIDHVEAHVLGPDLKPVDPGQPGELHIGGAGLARGYLRRPALTAERFIPHPLDDRLGERVFRTGDVVRCGVDGELEFVRRLGRIVKVRGFRIEPAEVEDALEAHSAIAASAVTSCLDGRGGERLVAHVVAAGDHAPTLLDLRVFLASRLPSHMLPSAVWMVDALPTTPSGKVDRRALEAAALERCSRGGGETGPRNQLERKLVKLWRRVLELERVGVTEDFFELGGDSLAAMRIVAEVERRTGVRLPASILLEASTPERMAKLIARSRPGGQPSELVRIRAGDGLRPFFWVAPSHATILPVRRLSDHLDRRRPVYALQSYGLEGDGGAPVEAVASRYVAAIRQVQAEGPYLLGGQCAGALVALEAAQQLQAVGQTVAMLAIVDAPPPLLRTDGMPRPRERRPAGSRGARHRLRRRLGRRVGWVRWRLRRPRRRVAFLWRALRSWREAPVRDLRTLQALYRQRKIPLRRFYAAERYPGRVCLFVSGDRDADGEAGEAGWRALVTGSLERVVVPGSHGDILAEPGVGAVGEHLDRRLREVEAVR